MVFPIRKLKNVTLIPLQAIVWIDFDSIVCKSQKTNVSSGEGITSIPLSCVYLLFDNSEGLAYLSRVSTINITPIDENYTTSLA